MLLLFLLVLAGLCLDNARKTIKYGGRKNVPSKTELESITVSVFLFKLT